MSCGYEGPHFGGGYNDAGCIDGYLWDLDSCESSDDGDGMYFTSGGDIPCPCCNTKEYVESCDDFHVSGNAKQRRKQLRESMRRVRTWAKT